MQLLIPHLKVLGGVLAQEKWWEIIDSAEEVRAVAALLPYKHPSKQLSVGFGSSSPTTALKPLTTAVAETDFRGKLVMSIYHSWFNFLPCDEWLKPLKGAK